MNSPLSVTCRCGYTAAVKPAARDQWGRCPSCRQPLWLGSTPMSPSAAAAPTKSTAWPAPFHDPATRTQLFAILGVAVLVLGYRYGGRLVAPATTSVVRRVAPDSSAVSVAPRDETQVSAEREKATLPLGESAAIAEATVATLLPEPEPVTPILPHRPGNLLPLDHPGATAVRGVAFVPHEPLAFVVYLTRHNSVLVKFDLTTGKALGPGVPLTQDGQGEVSLLPSTDGRVLVAAQSRSPLGLGLLDAQSGQPLQSLATGVAFLAPPIWARQELGVYWANREGHIATWVCRGELPELTGTQGKPVTRLALSADGRFLLSGDAEGEIRIWDTAEQGRYAASYRGHAGPIQWLATQRYADGVLVLSVSGRPGTALSCDLWDLQTQTRKATTTLAGRLLKVAVSPDWRLAVAGEVDGHVTVFDLASGQSLERVQAHRGEVVQLAVSSDGLFSLSGCLRSPDGQVDATVWLRGLPRRVIPAPSSIVETTP